MNSSLSNYRSDYQYAISKLNEIKDGDSFEDAYIATNLLRRVIETFVTFKYGHGDLKGKLNQLCMDASKSEIQIINSRSMPEDIKKSKIEAITEKYSQTDKILYSFINYGSHKFSGFTSADDAILQNYKSTIEKFFELVKSTDSAHCKYIEKL
jgi:hypothetical protein